MMGGEYKIGEVGLLKGKQDMDVLIEASTI